jgi:hypothetical protein
MKYHITIKFGVSWLTNEDGKKIGYMDKEELADLQASCEFALIEIEKTEKENES